MAQPTCPHCGNHGFEVTRTQVVGRGLVNYDLVHCAKCGAVVHVIDLTVRDQLDRIETGRLRT